MTAQGRRFEYPGKVFLTSQVAPFEGSAFDRPFMAAFEVVEGHRQAAGA
jgi:hypothetical protein